MENFMAGGLRKSCIYKINQTVTIDWDLEKTFYNRNFELSFKECVELNSNRPF